jgi:DNA-binding XRE family transcriptional regulator
MRVITHSAETVRELRRTLKLTQGQLAQLLGVSRRTIIRGEQRGLEVPWYSSGSIDRYELSRLWELAQQQAADLRNLAIAKVSPPAGGDTLPRPPAKVSPRKGARS